MTALSFLWIEPGGGVLVPRRAFAAPGAEAAFLEAVRGHIAAGKVQSPAQEGAISTLDFGRLAAIFAVLGDRSGGQQM